VFRPLAPPGPPDALRDDTVQYEIAAHMKILAVLGDVRACWPRLRVASQQGALVPDLI
jgi:hypothetical protein